MKRLAVLAAVASALAAPALAHATAPPPIARPNPVTYPIRLDYVDPLLGADGTTASLAPLEQGIDMAATRDSAFLRYQRIDDLGGFMPATVGSLALTSGGHDVLSPGRHASQIPLFSVAAGGAIDSFTFTGSPPSGPTPPPDNGNNPGISPPPPPSPENIPPPANQGFGGPPGGGHSGGGGGTTTTTTTGGGHRGGGTTTTTTQPPTTTTVVTTTVATTTTTNTPGGSGGGGGGGSGCSGGTCAAGACGVAGLSIDSSIPGCTLTISSATPGDSATETFTIQNTSGSAYTLSFMAGGANNNHLWQDLQMDLYDPSGGAPTPPLPMLTSWLGSFHVLTPLNPGQTVQYVVELYLPTTAGNADMGKTAVVDFTWSAA